MVFVNTAPTSSEYKLLLLRYICQVKHLEKAVENLGHSGATYNATTKRLEKKYSKMKCRIAV